MSSKNDDYTIRKLQHATILNLFILYFKLLSCLRCTEALPRNSAYCYKKTFTRFAAIILKRCVIGSLEDGLQWLPTDLGHFTTNECFSEWHKPRRGLFYNKKHLFIFFYFFYPLVQIERWQEKNQSPSSVFQRGSLKRPIREFVLVQKCQLEIFIKKCTKCGELVQITLTGKWSRFRVSCKHKPLRLHGSTIRY